MAVRGFKQRASGVRANLVSVCWRRRKIRSYYCRAARRPQHSPSARLRPRCVCYAPLPIWFAHVDEQISPATSYASSATVSAPVSTTTTGAAAVSARLRFPETKPVTVTATAKAQPSPAAPAVATTTVAAAPSAAAVVAEEPLSDDDYANDV